MPLRPGFGLYPLAYFFPMTQEERFYYRDLSWLSFNYRVLLEATDASLPLYERIKFLAIYSSNMGEFFKVRVASIQGLIKAKRDQEASGVMQPLTVDPVHLLESIFKEVHRQQEEFGQVFHQQILPELAQHHIHLILDRPEAPAHIQFVRDFFDEEVQPYLHPELLRKSKIRHFLRDSALYLAVRLRNRSRNHAELLPAEKKVIAHRKRIRYALLQIPTHYFPRFIELPRIGEGYYYMFLDDVIRCNLERIFPGYDILCCHSIKLNRNADLMIEDEFSGNLVDLIQESIKKRRVGMPARFLYDQDMPATMLKYLRETFELRKRELMPGGHYHSFFDFFHFPNPHAPALERRPMPPLPHPGLQAAPSMLEAIAARNWVVHFPYQSYDYVIRFLNQAATDPDVTEVYATQYRVASNSAIVNALVRAATNGKRVTVFVEIKARFDEAANLQSAREMQAAGVRIIYSIPGLKVHAKVALILRQEAGRERGYAYLSTGNFNEKTARVYADHGYFTSAPTVVAELKEVFAYLQDQHYRPRPFQHLLVAQFNMRDRLVALIEAEIAAARAGRTARIFLKINSLEDRDMIDKLYEAAQAGVEIRIMVRGICRLRPGLPGYGTGIEVRRLVDQYLEHARVLVFHQGGAEAMYLSSADWMTRNLSRRIEVAFPLDDPDIRAEIQAILRLQWADRAKAVRLDQDIRNIPLPAEAPLIRAQNATYEHLRAGTLVQEVPAGYLKF